MKRGCPTNQSPRRFKRGAGDAVGRRINLTCSFPDLKLFPSFLKASIKYSPGSLTEPLSYTCRYPSLFNESPRVCPQGSVIFPVHSSGSSNTTVSSSNAFLHIWAFFIRTWSVSKYHFHLASISPDHIQGSTNNSRGVTAFLSLNLLMRYLAASRHLRPVATLTGTMGLEGSYSFTLKPDRLFTIE